MRLPSVPLQGPEPGQRRSQALRSSTERSPLLAGVVAPRGVGRAPCATISGASHPPLGCRAGAVTMLPTTAPVAFARATAQTERPGPLWGTLKPPLPTNAWWENLVLAAGDQPFAPYPYLVAALGNVCDLASGLRAQARPMRAVGTARWHTCPARGAHNLQRWTRPQLLFSAQCAHQSTRLCLGLAPCKSWSVPSSRAVWQAVRRRFQVLWATISNTCGICSHLSLDAAPLH